MHCLSAHYKNGPLLRLPLLNFYQLRAQHKKANREARLKCFHNGIILIVNCFKLENKYSPFFQNEQFFLKFEAYSFNANTL